MDHILIDIIKILISFAVGAVLGFEREYHDKPAGLRTIILITVGATVFTMVSVSFDVNPERVASNIVTGIGFIGAGVMFRQGIDIKGITTAATIWMAAALGMAVAQELYVLTAVALILGLGTLAIVSKLEKKLFSLRQRKTYQITVADTTAIEVIENILREKRITCDAIRLLKDKGKPVLICKVSCGSKKHFELERFLVQNELVENFEV